MDPARVRDSSSEKAVNPSLFASESAEKERAAAGLDLPTYPAVVAEDQQVFQYDESRKLGITSAVFLILNKMIGTGSRFLMERSSR